MAGCGDGSADGDLVDLGSAAGAGNSAGAGGGVPLLGVVSVKHAAAPYAQPLIFLFPGGFLNAGAVERWGLHRRIALNLV